MTLPARLDALEDLSDVECRLVLAFLAESAPLVFDLLLDTTPQVPGVTRGLPRPGPVATLGAGRQDEVVPDHFHIAGADDCDCGAPVYACQGCGGTRCYECCPESATCADLVRAEAEADERAHRLSPRPDLLTVLCALVIAAATLSVVALITP